MKKAFLIFTAILVAILIIGLLGRALILDFAVKQLKGAFPGYQVTVGSAEIKNAGLISFGNIEVKKGAANRYRIKELDIRFTPLTLFNRSIPKIAVNECSIVISSRSEKLKDLIEFPSPKPGALFIVDSLEINGLVLEIHTLDCDINAALHAAMSIKEGISYNAVLKLNSINLGLLAKFLEASDKVEIEGSMNGELFFSGKDLRINEIKGEFKTEASGGTIAIKDEEFIKALAERSKQPVEMIRDSFKFYNYTKGTLSVSREKDSILFHLVMECLQGKRDLTVTFHGF